MINESHVRSIVKGISWRMIATSDTFLVVFIITCLLDQCSVENAIKIGVIEFFLKLLIYYAHERVWLKVIKSFTFSKQQSLLKTISWRFVATTTTFLISGAVLNDFNEIVLFIALLELISKFILYYVHERIWIKIPLGLKH
ncbi:MAG: DUF2061 domain-containing protein [Flavobacteriaceae bacterium]|jgi:uncharacterized membrane protein|nr:DUF2061 domain-containing protein [Flavobacteriaceae bacterium]